MQKELIILDEDKMWAKARIAELEKEIQDLGPEFYDVFNQSSETWHDNAPFDALRDRQSVLDAESQQLKRILRNSLPGIPGLSADVVGVGSEVVMEDEAGIRKYYFIAGDWTPLAGQMKGRAMVVSRNAPLATVLLDKRIGTEVILGKKKYLISAIDTLRYAI